ncbi:hypothetical protein B5807_01871 [Epicoccum nigrum]|uniref:Uncharacterized protein n=1 Tax=Epicoccum nigrum TaxID=105696 RepID=A0A1Y2M8L3_EPING|nr:hypothetical protein B5807_01871 [Epicoccum nigrum]
MHRKTPISVLVYNALFPSPTPTDPPSFSAHLSKNLVGEVRIETANFYGSLDTIEARYPGLNYAYRPHRKRLGRFPHHRRLFDAFDALGLTESEIQGFCRWEGTLWARERYERDEGVRVVDTTAMEIGAWVDTRRLGRASKGINVKTHIEVEIEQVALAPGLATAEDAGRRQLGGLLARDTAMRDGAAPAGAQEASDDDDDAEDQDDGNDDDDAHQADPYADADADATDHLAHSVGYSLNARLLHHAALRDAGAPAPVDPEWEAYWKEAAERGELNVDATREALRAMAGQLARVGAGAGAGAIVGEEGGASA